MTSRTQILTLPRCRCTGRPSLPSPSGAPTLTTAANAKHTLPTETRPKDTVAPELVPPPRRPRPAPLLLLPVVLPPAHPAVLCRVAIVSLCSHPLCLPPNAMSSPSLLITRAQTDVGTAQSKMIARARRVAAPGSLKRDGCSVFRPFVP